jgi:hypothetical protein
VHMRLSLSLNGSQKYIASQPGPGYLNAHLNLHNRQKECDDPDEVRIVGTVTEETETIHLKWPTLELAPGDVVELQVLPDGAGDPPVETRRSSESPSNLLCNVELAKELLALVSDFEGRLMKLLPKAEETESPTEYKKFSHAVGAIVYELGEYLLYPIYRRHKQLMPEELKGELL